MPIVTQRPITLSYFIADIAAALLTFNRMTWFRSRTGSDGPFYPMTAPAVTSATLLGERSEPHALAGKTLSVMVDGTTQVDVVFGGSDPYSTASAIADILAETALMVGTNEGGYLRLTSATTGSGSSLRILESEGAIALGFQTDDAAVGLGLDTTLASSTHEYFHTDQNADDTFWYRVQLYHNITGDLSNLGSPFPGASVPVLPASKTIVAYVNMVDFRGRPIEARRIVLSNVFLPNKVDQFGIFRHSVDILTDANGYAEVRLLRGMTLDVHVEGTTFTRRITLPGLTDVATSVDLLDPSLVTEDEFGIQEPNIDFAIRTS